MSEMFPREICVEVNGHNAKITNAPTLTSGTVGLPVRFYFDDAWEGLVKVAVFRAGDKTVDRMDIAEETTVPAEVLQRRHCELMIGVYGVNADGTLVIPTVYASAGVIQPGADPSGDESADPSLPVWQSAVRKDTENSVSRLASAVGANCFAGAKAYHIIAKGADNSVASADGYYVLEADEVPAEKIKDLQYCVTMTATHEFAGVIRKVGSLETGLSGIDLDGNHTTGLTGFKVYVSGYLAGEDLVDREAAKDLNEEGWKYNCNTFRIPDFPLLGTLDYGIGAWAEGYETKAIGSAAHAEGAKNTARSFAHAEGTNNHAIGAGSHAEGAWNRAYGDFSHVGGVGNNAFYNFQTVIGTYNKNKEDNIFEVGVGDGVKKNGFEVKKDGSARVLTESTEPDAVVRYSQLKRVAAETALTTGFDEPGTDRYMWCDLSRAGAATPETVTLTHMDFQADAVGEMPAGWVESPATPLPEITAAQDYFYQKVMPVTNHGNVFAFSNYHYKDYLVRYPLEKAVSKATLTYKVYLKQPSATANMGVFLPTFIYKGAAAKDGQEKGATPLQLLVQQVGGVPRLSVSYGGSRYALVEGRLSYGKWITVSLSVDVSAKSLLVLVDNIIMPLPDPTESDPHNWLPDGTFSAISAGTVATGLSNFYIDDVKVTFADKDPADAVGLLTTKKDGQIRRIYPVTKPEAVEGLKEYVLALLAAYSGQ